MKSQFIKDLPVQEADSTSLATAMDKKLNGHESNNLADFYLLEPKFQSNSGLNFQLQRINRIVNYQQFVDPEYGQSLRESVVALVAETQNYYVKLRDYLEKEILSADSKSHLAAINKLLDQLYLFQLNYELASIDDLTAKEYHRTEKALSRQLLQIDKIAQKLLDRCEDCETRLLVNELKSAPEKIRTLRELSIHIDSDFEFKSGDRLIGLGMIILNCDDQRLQVLVRDNASHLHERTFSEETIKAEIIREQLRVGRGGHMLHMSIGDNPSGGLRRRVPVVNKAFENHKSAFECGRVIGIVEDLDLLKYDLKLLWYSCDGSASIKAMPESALKHYTTAEVFKIWDTNLLKTALSANIFSSIQNLEHYRQRHPDFKIRGDQGYEICQSLKVAKWPITVHVIGKAESTGASKLLTDLRKDVAFFSQTENSELPDYTSAFIEHHHAKALVLVFASEISPILHKQLLGLKQSGFKILVLSKDNTELLLTQKAGSDFQVISLKNRMQANLEMNAVIEGLSAEARASYSDRIYVKNLKQLSASMHEDLDYLAEAKPNQALSKMPELLLGLKQQLRSSESDQNVIEHFHLSGGEQTLNGRTRTREYWNKAELIKLSEQLSKSALPANHPAVAIRGVTSKDLLTARQLESLLQKGAVFITLENQQNEIEGLVIAFPPEVVDKMYRTLAAELGRPQTVAFIYWIWLDPESNLAAGYCKLVNSLIAQQLNYGSTFIFASALERNTHSIRAALTLAGFDLIESECFIEGEPSIGLGFDLKADSSADPKVEPKDARQVLNTALSVFTEGSTEGEAKILAELYQQRVNETFDFLQAEYNFLSACIDLNVLLNKNPRFKSILSLQENAFDTLEILKQYIKFDLYDKFDDLLRKLIIDDYREQSIVELNILANTAIPENRRELKQKYKQLSAYLEGQGIVVIRNFKEWQSDLNIEMREDSVLLPPEIKIPEILSMYAKLSDKVKNQLLRWYNDSIWQKIDWPDQATEVIRRAGMEYCIAGWIESELERINSFIWTGNSERYNELPDTERLYYQAVIEFLNWYNQAARTGNLDSNLGLYAKPYFKAYLLGEN